MLTRRNWIIFTLLVVGVFALAGTSNLSRPSLEQTPSCGGPLLQAILSGDETKAIRLVESRQNLNTKGCEGARTPLIAAIGQKMPQVAKALILAGADPNIPSQNGVTPLMVASTYCYDEVARLLLDHGASVNDVDRVGTSALMNASGSNAMCLDGRVVSHLLEAGAKLELRDSLGQTALIVASFSGNESAVGQLVTAGAKLDVRTSDGKTALQIARDRRIGRTQAHDRVVQVLEEAVRNKQPN